MVGVFGQRGGKRTGMDKAYHPVLFADLHEFSPCRL